MENNMQGGSSTASAGLMPGIQMPPMLRRITVQEADNGFLITEQAYNRVSPVTLVAKDIAELQKLIGEYFSKKAE